MTTDAERYTAAAHAMQSGVRLRMTREGVPDDSDLIPGHASPKHLRVGVNSAMVDSSALAMLLIEKGGHHTGGVRQGDRRRHGTRGAVVPGRARTARQRTPRLMPLTDDPTDPRLGRGVGGDGMNEAYLVLSEEERAKGFVRPLRRAYVHRYMLDGSKVPTVLVTTEGTGGCGALTTMALALCETYARDPTFYGATYCTGCRTHLPVAEFHWDEDNEVVGS